MKLLSYFIILLILFQKCDVKKTNDSMNRLQIDTLKTTSEFKLLVEATLKQVSNSNQKITLANTILLVKIYNSISSYRLSEHEPYDLFNKKFGELYMNKVIDILGCQTSIGMGYYCNKYKLAIGGAKFPNNSYIIILELQNKSYVPVRIP